MRLTAGYISPYCAPVVTRVVDGVRPTVYDWCGALDRAVWNADYRRRMGTCINTAARPEHFVIWQRFCINILCMAVASVSKFPASHNAM